MSNLIRNVQIDDEPVVITLGPGDPDPSDVPLDCGPAEESDIPPPDPVTIDPLFEREQELCRRESVLDELEGQLLQEKSRLEGLVTHMAALVSNAHFETAALMKDAEHQALELAMAIARRLLRAELKLHPETIARVVEEALDAAEREVVVRIRVAPEDLPVLQSIWEVTPPTLIGRDVALVADPKIHPGGCIIDTQTGTIDGRLDSQWEAIEAAFQNMERENRATKD